MKKNMALIVALLLTLAACGTDMPKPEPSTTPTEATATTQPPSTATPAAPVGNIYLYGEVHANERILERELELWQEYYDSGLRHLFIESAYFTAEFLNLWMAADNDDILDTLFVDWQRTSAGSPVMRAFWQQIKADCPETVFHGTDVGHSFATTGARYLRHLEAEGLQASEQYTLAQAAIEQGRQYYGTQGDTYRENAMAENFIRAYDALGGQDIMGIYGAAHTGLDAMDFYGKVPCMANQLREHYGDTVFSEDLSSLAKVTEPLRTDTFTVNGKDYTAAFYGQHNTAWQDYVARAIWRLEDAYDDFKDYPKPGAYTPFVDFPMAVAVGQVFVVDWLKGDGSADRTYFRSDGTERDGHLVAEMFTLTAE